LLNCDFIQLTHGDKCTRQSLFKKKIIVCANKLQFIAKLYCIFSALAIGL